MTDDQCFLNTDVELFREGGPDGPMAYYQPSCHVTIDEKLGINVGGLCFVRSLTEWHELALEAAGGREAIDRAMRRE